MRGSFHISCHFETLKCLIFMSFQQIGAQSSQNSKWSILSWPWSGLKIHFIWKRRGVVVNILDVCVQFVTPRELLATVITGNNDIGMHTGFVAVQVAAVLKCFWAGITSVRSQFVATFGTRARGFIQSVLMVKMHLLHMCGNFVLPWKCLVTVCARKPHDIKALCRAVKISSLLFGSVHADFMFS